MRKAKRWRYYCDFCKKVGGSKWHMKKHEAGCTNNPNRVCGMCPYGEDDFEQDRLGKMIAIINDMTQPPEYNRIFWNPGQKSAQKLIITALQKLTHCPACIFAAIRQSDHVELFDVYDFEKEKKSFWNLVNYDRQDYGYRY